MVLVVLSGFGSDLLLKATIRDACAVADIDRQHIGRTLDLLGITWLGCIGSLK